MFRQAALNKITSPEQLDTLMVVTRPRAWATLAALGLIVVLLVLWSVFSSMTTTAKVAGMLLPPGGMAAVTAPVTGTVGTIAAPGQRVVLGQRVATVQLPGGHTITVRSAAAGQVAGVAGYPGAYVTPGSPLLSVEPAGKALVATFFAPVGVISEIRDGMSVRIAPSGVNPEAYGFMLGKVSQVFSYPASHAGAMALFQNAAVVQQLVGSGLAYEVRVTPLAAHTPSGYAWSSGEGPPQPLPGGTLVVGSFVVSSVHPIGLLFRSKG